MGFLMVFLTVAIVLGAGNVLFWSGYLVGQTRERRHIEAARIRSFLHPDRRSYDDVITDSRRDLAKGR